ncbi:MAG: nucleotidyltransferase family protein [Candidatus Muiribacteriota bacterium]
MKNFNNLSPEKAGKHGILNLLSVINKDYLKKYPFLNKYIAQSMFITQNQFKICCHIQKFLSKKNIDFYFLKGIVSSHLIYNNIYARNSKDIDIFIKKRDFMKALKIFQKKDFITDIPENLIKKLYLPFGIDCSMKKKITENLFVNIDLHCVKDNDFSQLTLHKEKILNNFFYIPAKKDYLKLLLKHARKHRYAYLKDLLDIYYFKVKKRKNILKLINKALKKTPCEGRLIDYINSFFHLNFKDKLSFIIKHIFMPHKTDIKKYNFKCVYFYIMIKPLRVCFQLLTMGIRQPLPKALLETFKITGD